jgi:hypothetical protein
VGLSIANPEPRSGERKREAEEKARAVVEKGAEILPKEVRCLRFLNADEIARGLSPLVTDACFAKRSARGHGG